MFDSYVIANDMSYSSNIGRIKYKAEELCEVNDTKNVACIHSEEDNKTIVDWDFGSIW